MKLLCSILSTFVPFTLGVKHDDQAGAARQLMDTLHQLTKFFTGHKYDRYGCYCFQNGLENAFFSGHGERLDAADSACFKFHQCQRCLGVDNGKQCDHFTKYNITFEEDPITLEKSAQCHDEENSCGRNLCECSVAFAKDMQRVETDANFEWNLGFSKYSMDREDLCGVDVSASANLRAKLVSTVQLKSAGKESNIQCCGDYPSHRFPFDSESKGCCGNKTYDQKWLQCCNGEVKSRAVDC